MITWLYAALLALGAPAAPSAPEPPQETGAARAEPDGRDAANAIKVASVDEEYAVLRRLGLKPELQSLMMIDNRPYDVIRAVDPRTGKKREVWFDIGSFFGKGFLF